MLIYLISTIPIDTPTLPSRKYLGHRLSPSQPRARKALSLSAHTSIAQRRNRHYPGVQKRPKQGIASHKKKKKREIGRRRKMSKGFVVPRRRTRPIETPPFTHHPAKTGRLSRRREKRAGKRPGCARSLSPPSLQPLSSNYRFVWSAREKLSRTAAAATARPKVTTKEKLQPADRDIGASRERILPALGTRG